MYIVDHLRVHARGGVVRASTSAVGTPPPSSSPVPAVAPVVGTPLPVAAPVVGTPLLTGVPLPQSSDDDGASQLPGDDTGDDGTAAVSAATPTPPTGRSHQGTIVPPSPKPKPKAAAKISVVAPVDIFWMDSNQKPLVLDGSVAPCCPSATANCVWRRSGYMDAKLLTVSGPIPARVQRYYCTIHHRRVLFWDPVLRPAVEAQVGALPSHPCLHVGEFYVTPDFLNLVWKLVTGSSIQTMDVGRVIVYMWQSAIERRGVRGDRTTFAARLRQEVDGLMSHLPCGRVIRSWVYRLWTVEDHWDLKDVDDSCQDATHCNLADICAHLHV